LQKGSSGRQERRPRGSKDGRGQGETDSISSPTGAAAEAALGYSTPVRILSPFVCSRILSLFFFTVAVDRRPEDFVPFRGQCWVGRRTEGERENKKKDPRHPMAVP